MNQNKNTKKKRKGFTLIELIIVLAIMAIIAAIAIPNFTAVRDNSKNKADVQSCETIKRTVLMLVADGTITPAATDTTYKVTVSGGTVAVSPAESTVQSHLKDIKAPQGDVFTGYDATTGKPNFTSGTAANKYQIVIKSTGDVLVTTIHE